MFEQVVEMGRPGVVMGIRIAFWIGKDPTETYIKGPALRVQGQSS